jgi:hypothetical protein
MYDRGNHNILRNGKFYSEKKNPHDDFSKKNSGEKGHRSGTILITSRF